MTAAETEIQTYTAFEGARIIAQGALKEIVPLLKKRTQNPQQGSLLIFNDATGKTMDFDLRGSAQEVLQRLQVFVPAKVGAKNPGPGRPRLGVVSREVSLLPQQWEWLETQPAGASATLRRLVEEARKKTTNKDKVARGQERTYRVMSVLAGKLAGYEEALRFLYRKDREKFKSLVTSWPEDIKCYLIQLAEDVF